MSRRREKTFRVWLVGLLAMAGWAALRVPPGIGPGPEVFREPDPGISVRRFDSRWIPVTLPHGDILEALRDLRLQTSTMWFRIDCTERVYEAHEIELVYDGGTVWVAAGQPKPTAPPARCMRGRTPRE